MGTRTPIRPAEEGHPMRNRDSTVGIPFWQPGDQIVLREILHQQVWTARPAIVVHDGPEVLAVYLMPGTRYKHPRLVDRDEVPRLLASPTWRLVDVTWRGGG